MSGKVARRLRREQRARRATAAVAGVPAELREKLEQARARRDKELRALNRDYLGRVAILQAELAGKRRKLWREWEETRSQLQAQARGDSPGPIAVLQAALAGKRNAGDA